MTIFSATEMMRYQRCIWQWDAASFNRRGLAPVIGATYFEIGTAVHKSLADWLLNPQADLVDVYGGHAAAIAGKAINHYKLAHGVGPAPVELVSLMEGLDLGKSMMQNYQEHYKTPLDRRYSVVQVEQTIVVPIPGTEHQLETTLDAIIADLRGHLLPVDHKTFTYEPGADMINNNFQFKCYVMALQLSLPENIIDGFAYNGMRKKAAPTNKQTLADMFHREIVKFTKAEMVEHYALVAWLANQMDNTTYLPKTVPWNGCRGCEFMKLCHADSKQQNYQTILRKDYTQRERTTAYEEA